MTKEQPVAENRSLEEITGSVEKQMERLIGLVRAGLFTIVTLLVLLLITNY